jgi:hypothetical protein
VAKTTKNKKSKKNKNRRNGGTDGPNEKNGDQTKEGRHVGLDFYDLLIEARFDLDRESARFSVSVMAVLDS